MHYFPIYERHLHPFVNRPVTMIEIGCGGGGSSQMWKQYLGPYARIVGLDVNPACRAYEDEQVKVRIGSQSDTAFLQDVLDEFGVPDVVLDDGSHQMADVNATFNWLYSRVHHGGVYLVEDLHTAYWSEYGGGLRQPGTFIERCKELIDEFNAEDTRGALPPTEFGVATRSMHIYNSMVAFERGRTMDTRSIITGAAQHY